MNISEIIKRLEDIKKKYGDCRVFILSKSFYEGGTIIDARDIALTSIPSEHKDVEPEIIVMISNCPIIPDQEASEEEAEKILHGGALR